MNKNRKNWLNLTLVLLLLTAPFQVLVAAQSMSDRHDCMSMSVADHHPSSAVVADSNMKCHADGVDMSDTCAPDCSECSTGTAATTFSITPVLIKPARVFSSFPAEASIALYLFSEFRPPRV